MNKLLLKLLLQVKMKRLPRNNIQVVANLYETFRIFIFLVNYPLTGAILCSINICINNLDKIS